MQNPFKWLGHSFRSPGAKAAVNRAVAMIPVAMPYIQEIAALTPNRSDDEIVRLFARYGLPWVDRYLALPHTERGTILASAAGMMVKRQFPREADHLIDTAVQLAYTTYQADVAATAGVEPAVA